jgi:hypothetical protein
MSFLIENIVEESTAEEKMMDALRAFHRGAKIHNPSARIAEKNLTEEQSEKLRGIIVTLSKIDHENTTIAKALAALERDMANGYLKKEQFVGSEILATFSKGAEETNFATNGANLLTLVNLVQKMRMSPIPRSNERPLHDDFDEITEIYKRLDNIELADEVISKAREFVGLFI